MDFIEVIGVVMWIWGAYKAWGTVSAWNWEWVNRPEPLSYVVKAAICILIGFFVLLIKLARAGLALASALFRFL